MNEFNDYYKKIMEGIEDVPNYRRAIQKDGKTEPKCTSCKFNDDGLCEKYDFMFDSEYTCDDWETNLGVNTINKGKEDFNNE